MREIYLIRHGMPAFEGNLKRCIGQTDCPLSLQGEQEILRVKEYLLNKNIESIYSSPLIRCRDSARIIAEDKTPIFYLDELKEINMGDWENKTFEEIRKQYPDEYRKRGEDFANFAPQNGESFAMCLERCKKAFKSIINNSAGNIAVLGHAGVNRVLLCWLLNADLNIIFQIKQPYGCINVIYEEDGKLNVDKIGLIVYEKPHNVHIGG